MCYSRLYGHTPGVHLLRLVGEQPCTMALFCASEDAVEYVLLDVVNGTHWVACWKRGSTGNERFLSALDESLHVHAEVHKHGSVSFFPLCGFNTRPDCRVVLKQRDAQESQEPKEPT